MTRRQLAWVAAKAVACAVAAALVIAAILTAAGAAMIAHGWH